VQNKDNDALLRRIARKIARNQTIPPNAVFIHTAEDAQQHSPIKALFMPGYARDTLLLWAAFFLNLMVAYFLYSWIPTLAGRLRLCPGASLDHRDPAEYWRSHQPVCVCLDDASLGIATSDRWLFSARRAEHDDAGKTLRIPRHAASHGVFLPAFLSLADKSA
jgi:hypothetical protein